MLAIALARTSKPDVSPKHERGADVGLESRVAFPPFRCRDPPIGGGTPCSEPRSSSSRGELRDESLTDLVVQPERETYVSLD
jgi:hypothetical protein